MPLNLSDDKSTLIQVMAWCRQAPSHYLSQCWPRSMSPNGVTRPQWVNSYLNAMSFCTRPLEAYHLKDPGMRLNTKTPYYQITRIDIPIIKIRRSHDRIIFIKRPPQTRKDGLYIGPGPSWLVTRSQFWTTWENYFQYKCFAAICYISHNCFNRLVFQIWTIERVRSRSKHLIRNPTWFAWQKQFLRDFETFWPITPVRHSPREEIPVGHTCDFHLLCSPQHAR